MFSLWNKGTEIGISEIYATKMYLPSYTELFQIWVSGIKFVGRISSRAMRMRGSNHNPSFILKKTRQNMWLNEFEDHGCSVKYKGYILINYYRYLEEEIISCILDSITKFMIHV